MKHKTEDTLHLILNVALTTTCLTSYANRGGSANPGPWRGKEGAIEKHIAVKWHVIALHEAIEYLQHDCLTSHFYVTHYAGGAVLFNKNTFHSDIKVTSVYFHDTRDGQQQVLKEGQSG